MSETIEDRARDALNTIKHVTQWLKTRADLSVDTDYGWRANYNALKSTHKVLDDLMAEREALRWIPCEERLPEKSGNYRTTESIQPMGAEGFLYLLNFSYFDKTTKQWKGRGKIVAWMEHPSPYTPEEK